MYISCFIHNYTILLSITESLEMVLTLQNVTQDVLFSYAARGQYAGITKDPESRRRKHEKEGYNGIMYCASTQNMELAENKLLKVCPCYGNKQRRSNASPDPGCVYIIV